MEIIAGSIPDNVLNLLKYVESGKTRIEKFMRYELAIHKGVFPFDSPFSFSSLALSNYVLPAKGSVVLDIGTGTGIQAVMASKAGAGYVIGVDIDERAVSCARENFRRNRVCGEVIHGDLFDAVPHDELFEIIVADLPFTNADFDTEFKHLLFDPDFKTHDRFLKDAGKYLKPERGRVLISGGDMADEMKLMELVEGYKYTVDAVYTEHLLSINWKAYKLKPRTKW